MSKKHRPTKSTPSSSVSHRPRKERTKNLSGLWIGLGIVVLAAITFLLLKPKQTLPTEISVAQAHEKYQAGALFLDVRTQEEWVQGHIAKSILIPLDELPNRLNELPRDQDIVVVCRSGARSKEGSALLRQAGFTRVTCMTGGIQAWVTAGYPIQQ